MGNSCARFRFFVSGLLLVPLIVLAAGCSKQGKVSGTVTYKGKPLTSGEVHFFPDAKSTSGPFASQIGADGSYSISKLPPGPAKITVMTGSPEPPMPPGMGKGKGGSKMQEGMKKRQEMIKGKAEGQESEAAARAKAEKVKLPEKYSDPDKSGLTITVTGGQQDHPITMD